MTARQDPNTTTGVGRRVDHGIFLRATHWRYLRQVMGSQPSTRASCPLCRLAASLIKDFNCSFLPRTTGMHAHMCSELPAATASRYWIQVRTPYCALYSVPPGFLLSGTSSSSLGVSLDFHTQYHLRLTSKLSPMSSAPTSPPANDSRPSKRTLFWWSLSATGTDSIIVIMGQGLLSRNGAPECI